MISNIDKHEEALIHQYGFVVTTVGPDYIVADPQLPKQKKNKLIGHNLYMLLLQAIDQRNKLKIRVVGDDNVVSPDFTKKVSTPKKTPRERVVLHTPVDATPASTTPPVKGNKLYLIKKMLLMDPKFSTEDITKALEADGLSASISTIATVRSDFLHSIRVIKDMGRWKE